MKPNSKHICLFVMIALVLQGCGTMEQAGLQAQAKSGTTAASLDGDQTIDTIPGTDEKILAESVLSDESSQDEESAPAEEQLVPKITNFVAGQSMEELTPEQVILNNSGIETFRIVNAAGMVVKLYCRERDQAMAQGAIDQIHALPNQQYQWYLFTRPDTEVLTPTGFQDPHPSIELILQYNGIRNYGISNYPDNRCVLSIQYSDLQKTTSALADMGRLHPETTVLILVPINSILTAKGVSSYQNDNGVLTVSAIDYQAALSAIPDLNDLHPETEWSVIESNPQD